MKIFLVLSFQFLYFLGTTANAGVLLHGQIKEDLKYTEHMLKKAYSGSRFIEKSLFASVLKRIGSISKESMTTKELCYKLQTIFETLPDNHLLALLRVNGGMNACTNKFKNQRKAKGVGKNLQQDPRKMWMLTKKKTKKGNDVDVLAISSFDMISNSRESQQFIASSSYLYTKPYFIIDLRENSGGGTNVPGEWIRKLFTGTKKLAPDYWILQSPEAFEVWVNSSELSVLWSESKEDKKYYRDEMARYKSLKAQAIKGTLPLWQQGKYFIITGTALKNYSGAIYILQDRVTASTSEVFIEWLVSAFGKKVIRVGQNTSGTGAYGNVGYAILPNSKIYIQLGTKHFPSRFGEIEKKGIIPDIYVEEGADALDLVLSKI